MRIDGVYSRRIIFLAIFLAIMAFVRFVLNFWFESMNLLLLFVSFGIFLSDSVANELRYYNKYKLNTDDKTYSINPDDIHKINNWFVTKLGGFIQAYSKKGGEGTLVVPQQLVDERGKKINVNTEEYEVDKEELPPRVRKFVEKKNMKPPYYFSITPSSYIIEKVNETTQKDIADLIDKIQAKIKDLSKQNKRKDDIIDNRMKNLNKLVETSKETDGRGKLSKIHDKLSSNEKKEKNERR